MRLDIPPMLIDRREASSWVRTLALPAVLTLAFIGVASLLSGRIQGEDAHRNRSAVEVGGRAVGQSLARALKDPVNVEIMQTQLLAERAPDIPPEAICVHTRRGQEAGETMYTWFLGTLQTAPEAPGRDHTWRDQLVEEYRRVDPPS